MFKCDSEDVITIILIIVILMLIGALIALGLLVWKRDRAATNKAVGHALTTGATVLLIICAGGAFGGVLRHTGIAEELGAQLDGMQAFALPALFLITTLVRTAQGSATVAMITSAPIAKAFIESGHAHVNPVYFAIAIIFPIGTPSARATNIGPMHGGTRE